VSGGGTLLGDLLPSRAASACCGASATTRCSAGSLLIGEIEAAGVRDVHRIPQAGHWSAYENAPEVNRLMLEFFSS
jgi:hypothetical protein